MKYTFGIKTLHVHVEPNNACYKMVKRRCEALLPFLSQHSYFISIAFFYVFTIL